jgi:hypothetical protein
MIIYIIKEMTKHLTNLLLINVGLVFLLRKNSTSEYKLKLVKQPIRDVVTSAAFIGITLTLIPLFFLIVLKWDKNMLVVIAAVLISFGTGRQIFATALDTVTTNMSGFLSSWASTLHFLTEDKLMTPEWRSIEIQVELILFGKGIHYTPPAKLDGTGIKADPQQLYKYLNDHKEELEYVGSITNDDSSYIAFAQYATKHLRHKMQIYLQLLEVQERVGGVNTIVLIAAGTFIWLFS